MSYLDIKCCKCGASYFTIRYSTSTAMWSPTIIKDGKVISSNPNYETHHCQCIACGAFFDATEHNCVIAIEANPPIYNTNFINTTKQALDFISRIDTSGLRLNLDVGAMVYSREGVSVLYGYEKYINHVHISEPYLKPIEKRAIHKELASYLKEVNYKGYVSIEVGKQEDTESLFSMMDYVCSVFE